MSTSTILQAEPALDDGNNTRVSVTEKLARVVTADDNIRPDKFTGNLNLEHIKIELHIAID